MKCAFCSKELNKIQICKKNKFCSTDCCINSKKRNIINDFSIDTDEGYYWAGFLFGDGSVDNNCKIQVCLSIKDIEHLIKLSNFIFDKNFVRSYETRCHLQINDKNICSNLRKFGIIPNKTQNSLLRIPNENFIKDFIRGYFDADGWITEKEYRHNTNNKFYKKSIFGICSYLRLNLEIINEMLPIKGTITKKSNQELYEIRWQSSKDILIIRNFLNGKTKLERKWKF